MTEALDNMTETQRWNFLAWTDQRSPALSIVARGDQIREVSATQFTVCSQSRPGTFHHVLRTGAKWTCDCEFFVATKKVCVHVLAIRYKIGLQDQPPNAPRVESAPTCDKCRSTDLIRYGVRHNQSGDVSTYLCKTCGRRFTGRDGFHKRRAEPEKIALALDLYFRGLSVRKVSQHFEQAYGLKVSHVTVYAWVRFFGKLAAEWMDAQGARVGDQWHVDETVVNVGGDNRYLWNILDGETRFALATHVSRGRDLKNTRAPFKKAKLATEDRPSEILSDGMMTYPEAISKEFGRRASPLDDAKKVHGHGSWFTPHHRVPSIRAKVSNNKIERFHGTEKERTKVMRAFKTPDGTSDLMEGFRAHYNLVKTHATLGTTPGEAAGIPIGNGQRWLKVLQQAATRKLTPEENGPDHATT